MLSRIGRRPVPIPQGVKVEIRDGIIAVQGPKGKLEKAIPPLVEVKVEENEIRVLPAQTQKRLAKKVKAFHGLARALINNLVVGVTQGFTRSLDIVGLGYRAELKGNTLVLNVGYSCGVSSASRDFGQGGAWCRRGPVSHHPGRNRQGTGGTNSGQHSEDSSP